MKPRIDATDVGSITVEGAERVSARNHAMFYAERISIP
jgi:hypothetical protein